MQVAKQIGRAKISAEERDYRRARITAVREGLGITQDDMAKKCGLPRSSYNKMETGRDAVSGVEALRGLAVGWGVLMDDVYDYLEGVIELGDITRRRDAMVADRPPAAHWLVVHPNVAHDRNKTVSTAPVVAVELSDPSEVHRSLLENDVPPKEQQKSPSSGIHKDEVTSHGDHSVPAKDRGRRKR